jgi:hypothetical protein
MTDKVKFPYCQFCPHLAHPPGQKCYQCDCKGRKGFWARLVENLGNAIGQAKFGN